MGPSRPAAAIYATLRLPAERDCLKAKGPPLPFARSVHSFDIHSCTLVAIAMPTLHYAGKCLSANRLFDAGVLDLAGIYAHLRSRTV